MGNGLRYYIANDVALTFAFRNENGSHTKSPILKLTNGDNRAAFARRAAVRGDDRATRTPVANDTPVRDEGISNGELQS